MYNNSNNSLITIDFVIRVPEKAKTIFKTSGASMRYYGCIVAHKGVFKVGKTPINLKDPIRWTHAIIINRGRNAAIFLAKLFRPGNIITNGGRTWPFPEEEIYFSGAKLAFSLVWRRINFCNLHSNGYFTMLA